MKIKKQPNSLRKKVTLILVATLLVGVVSYGAFAKVNNKWPFRDLQANTQMQDTTRETNSVDYSGPTDDDVAESQNAKKRLEEKPKEDKPNEQNPQTALNNTPVAISFADKVGQNFEVRAFIPGIIEGTGTCKASLTQGSITVTASSKAFIDSTSSQCQPITIPLDKLSQHGTWSLVVTYESPSSKGSSGSNEVSL